jgi:hypothetical protein
MVDTVDVVGDDVAEAGPVVVAAEEVPLDGDGVSPPARTMSWPRTTAAAAAQRFRQVPGVGDLVRFQVYHLDRAHRPAGVGPGVGQPSEDVEVIAQGGHGGKQHG